MILPALLAGPVLRRVEPLSVTVWLAFSKKQTTQLVIWNNGEEEGSATEVARMEGFMVKSDAVETVEVATNLHISVITADTNQTKLVETKSYSYNVYYGDSKDALTNDLGTSGLLHPKAGTDPEKFFPLGYNVGAFPTIVIPQEKLENLHVVHGSCRKISGGGDDAFRHLDTLLNKTIKEAKTDTDKFKNRPQQLFLTGDQIYADEIPRLVLPFINALGSQLFSDKKEQLVIKASATETITIPADIEHFPPACRQFLVNDAAKFTGNGVSSHLLSLQEFCSTYLHYWSPDVWNPDLKLMLEKYKEKDYDEEIGSFNYYYLINEIKNFEVAQMAALLFKAETPADTAKKISDVSAILEILKSEPATALTDLQKAIVDNKWKPLYNTGETVIADFDAVVKIMQQVESMDENQKKVLSSFFSLGSIIYESKAASDFLQVLPLARRVLANIPAYMIFDDHEMTDDWNFSQIWKNRVHTTSLGIQVLRNGLMAYTIFQDWGNVPAEYPYNLLNPPADITDLETKLNDYQNAFGKTKGNKLELLKKITEYGKAISADNRPEAPGDLSNLIDKFLLVGETTTEAITFVTPVRWHFDFPTGTAHTFFLDTRTRREYDQFTASPGLLSKEALNDQLPERIAEMKYPLVFVISPVPALALPVVEEFAQPLVGSIESGFSSEGLGGAPIGAISGALKRDNEGWGFSEKHLEQFLERLALFKKVVILSGDVHYGYSAYADYWKERKEANHARIIQLVSSSFKNGWDLDFVLLKSGFAQRLLGGFDFEFERHGWKDKTLKIKGNMAPRHRIRLRRNPVVLPRQGWYEGTTIDPSEPDWTWRLRISVDETEYKDLEFKDSEKYPKLPVEIEKDLTEESVAAIGDEVKKTIMEMADRHNSLFKLGRSRRIIWQPHIGHIFFTKIGEDAAKLALNHEFHYSCRSDGFLNADISPDPDTAGIISDAFTLHKINIDVTADELKPPKTLNELPEPATEPTTEPAT